MIFFNYFKKSIKVMITYIIINIVYFIIVKSFINLKDIYPFIIKINFEFYKYY